MKKHNAILIGLISLSLANIAQADERSMSEFYADPQYQAFYGQTKQAGKFKELRKSLVSGCLKEPLEEKQTSDELNQKCACVAEKLKSISDEVIFYESIMSYERYQARDKATKNKDFKQVSQLRKLHASKTIFTDRINQACQTK